MQQLWPYIYEKAWMKIKSDIPRIFNTNPKPLQVFNWFLNIPSREINLSRVNRQNFKNFIDNNPRSYYYYFYSHQNPKYRIGITPNQYFSLLFINRQQSLYSLISPTKQFLYKGRYADRQTQKSFPLQFDQLFQQFSHCTVIYYYPTFRHTSISIRTDPQTQVFMKFKVRETSPTAITIVQDQNDTHQVMIDLVNLTSETTVEKSNLDNVMNKLEEGEYLLRLFFKPLDKERIAPINSTVIFYNERYISEIDVRNTYAADFLRQLQKKCQLEFLESSIDRFNFAFCVFWQQNRYVFYIKKTSITQQQLNIRIVFIEINNLICRSHNITKCKIRIKELRENGEQQYFERQFDCVDNIRLRGTVMIILETDDLTKQSMLGKAQVDSQ